MIGETKKYTLKEVAQHLNVTTASLKRWEKEFDEFVYVHRTKNGSRIFHQKDVITLHKIKLLKEKNVSNEDIKYILEIKEEKVEEEASEYDLKYEEIVSLQSETIQAVQIISASFEELKEEFLNNAKEVNEVLKGEVRKEISKGNSITQGIVQTYTEEVAENYQQTYKQIRGLKEEMEKEQDEKIFLQKKVEEREELFKEFVQNYRQAAASNEQRKEKLSLSYWYHLLVGTK